MNKPLEQSSAGTLFRPRPEGFLSNDKKLFVVLTSWGGSALKAKDVFEELESQHAVDADYTDKTLSIPKMTSLNALENIMRAGVLEVNQNIYSKINEEEYEQGFELLYAAVYENMCAFIQVGSPLALIDHPGRGGGLRGLGAGGLSAWSCFSAGAAPLPRELLGVHEDISFHPRCFRFQEGERLILLNHSHAPASWFGSKNRTIAELNQAAHAENEDYSPPFWLRCIYLTRAGFQNEPPA